MGGRVGGSNAGTHRLKKRGMRIEEKEDVEVEEPSPEEEAPPPPPRVEPNLGVETPCWRGSVMVGFMPDDTGCSVTSCSADHVGGEACSLLRCSCWMMLLLLLRKLLEGAFADVGRKCLSLF